MLYSRNTHIMLNREVLNAFSTQVNMDGDLQQLTNPIIYLFHMSQCTIQNSNAHISVLNGALCYMDQMHRGISEIGLLHGIKRVCNTWTSRERHSLSNPRQTHNNENTKYLNYWPSVKEIHRWPVDSPYKGPVIRNVFPWRPREIHCSELNVQLHENPQGAVSIRKKVLPGMAIPMLKIRRPNGRLIFNMEIAIRR